MKVLAGGGIGVLASFRTAAAGRFLKDVSRELYKIGAVMKQADFKDVDQE